MSRLSVIMDTGKRSMMNSQTALQTVGHNIANKSTEGYSRQRVEVQTSDPVSEGSLRIGTGSKAVRVTRVNNPFLEKQIEKESAHSSYLNSKADAMSRVEQVYNEQMNKGLGATMDDFFNAYRELSNTPESATTRTLVRETGQSLTKEFNRVHSDLSSVQKDLDTQLRTQVNEVNQITKEIASLNEKISQVEIQGIDANDERDRRDVLIKKLNDKMDITWGENETGQVTITAAKAAVLVSGFSSMELKAQFTNDRDRVEVYYENPGTQQLTHITDRISGGAMGAAIDVRDKYIEELKSNMDEMAYGFADEVNKAHRLGVDLKGRQGGDFFETPESVQGASLSLKLDDSILNDANRIVTGLKQGGPGDNTVANVIANIQSQNVMNDGTTTFDDYYHAKVGEVGVVTERALKTNESQKNIVDQLNHVRESISGVSLDEEATKMIEFQKSFEASARMIRTADEMFDTVLNLKRL